MNESAEYTRLLAQAYSKLADDYSAMWKREDAARAEIQRLEELLEKWMAEATRQSERADAAEAIIAATLRELPVGNINTHMPESLAERVAYLVKEHAEAEQRAEVAEAYVQALEEVCDSEQLKCAQSSARQQGGAK